MSAGSIAKWALHLGVVAATAVTTLPVSMPGQLWGVSAVPHSSDVWVEGIAGINNRPIEARRHNHHWRRMAAPALGGSLGSIRGIAAGSAHVIWLVGSRQIAPSEQTPAVWRWTGKRFAPASLPKLSDADSTAMSVSASSATNAWVVGQMDFPGTNDPAALHWDGKRWTAVSVPAPLMAISTSGPRNAWAVGLDAVGLFHWNGQSWSAHGVAPTGASFVDVATSSPNAAYVVGLRGGIPGETGVRRGFVLRFNGKTWSHPALANSLTHVEFTSVTMRGASAWAVGFSVTAQVPERTVIEHTTGGVWRSQRSTGAGADLESVSAATAHRAYAVGSQSANVAANRTLFDVFNGRGWKAAPSKF